RGCHGEAARPPADAGAVGDAGGRVGKDVPALPDPADLAGAGREPKRLPPEAGVTELVRRREAAQLVDASLQSGHPSRVRARRLGRGRVMRDLWETAPAAACGGIPRPARRVQPPPGWELHPLSERYVHALSGRRAHPISRSPRTHLKESGSGMCHIRPINLSSHTESLSWEAGFLELGGRVP